MQFPRKMSVNVMASISRTLGNRHDGSNKHSNEVKLAGEESKDKLYEPKHRQKVVRVLTVVAYVISVSLAAIILSLYYTYIWDPKDQALYTVRQTSLNSTSKVECLNLSIPVLAELARTINGSHNTKVPTNQFVKNESGDQRTETNVSIEQQSTDLLPDTNTEDVESLRDTSELENFSVQPELQILDEDGKGSGKERLIEDTSDFDFV